MIDAASAIVVFNKLAIWGMRLVNQGVKFNKLTQKKTPETKGSSSAISKIDRQLKDAEIKYYQGKTKYDLDFLAIEKQKLANDNIRIEIEETRLEIDADRLKLSKQERKDRLEISRLHRELLKEIQVEETQVKLLGIQTDWDKDTWFSKISREETKAILTKYNHRLLILTSPLFVDPYFENAQDFQQWSFDRDMGKVDKFLSQYYPPQSAECPVQFYYDYFRETISKIDTNRLQDLLSSVATYVLYCDIDDDNVNFRVVHWQTQQSEATHFPPFEWDWRETKDLLIQQGQSEVAAIRSIKQNIIEIHRLLTAYLADSYYLTIDPFYEPQLFEIFKQQKQAVLEPFVESLREFQAEQRTGYYQELARIEAEHLRADLARQQELSRQQELARQQELSRQQELARQQELKGKLFSFTVPLVNDTGTIINQTTHEARCLIIDIGNGVPLEMVYIPGGTFLMGEDQDHRVTFQPFYMGKYAVTQAQYQAIMGTNPAQFKGVNRPVENVNWHHAVEFCTKLSQRTTKQFSLPSESQWEYACRAGTTTPFYFGETITSDLVNYDGTRNYGNGPKGQYREQTTDVGSFPPNAFGLYDMHGNVWEWCADMWLDSYVGAPTDGSISEKGDSSRSPLRGGSWNYLPDYCRSAFRFNDSRDFANKGIGFRFVCECGRT